MHHITVNTGADLQRSRQRCIFAEECITSQLTEREAARGADLQMDASLNGSSTSRGAPGGAAATCRGSTAAGAGHSSMPHDLLLCSSRSRTLQRINRPEEGSGSSMMEAAPALEATLLPSLATGRQVVAAELQVGGGNARLRARE